MLMKCLSNVNADPEMNIKKASLYHIYFNKVFKNRGGGPDFNLLEELAL